LTDLASLIRTRDSLHGVAELLLAGPQYAASHDIRLRPVPGGFATVGAPDLRVEGDALVTAGGSYRLTGTYRSVATAAGIEPRTLDDVYSGGLGIGPDDLLAVDAEQAKVIAEGFAWGDEALKRFAPDADRVLWPEHFDLGSTVGEVNYGMSPGDSQLAEPYAYVGPWTPRRGEFWNFPFGAARPLHELADVAAVVAFFEEGAARAATDPAGS